MKRISVFCLLFCMLFILSCQKQPPRALTMVEKVLETHVQLPAGNMTYHAGALPGQRAYMTSRLRTLLYDGGMDRNIPEFEGVLDYAVNLSDGQYGMEIHVFCMKSEADARNMEKLLQRRVKLLKRRSLYLYAPSVYENYFASATVITEGKVVFLLATGMNDEIAKQLKDML